MEGYGADGAPSYATDAVRRIIAGLAPNLKKVAVLNSSPGCLATECRFPALKTPVLKVAATNLTSPLPGSFWIAATSFLLSLPPLVALGVIGTANHSFLQPILRYHGPLLRMLWLSSEAASPKLIKDIAQNCLSIRKMGLRMRRSKGDATEVATYTLLGSLPMLQELSLILDCSDARVLAEQGRDDDPDAILESPNDPSFDEFDQQMLKVQLDYNRYPRRGHVRDAFINCAVDENLARSIFVAISSGKNKSIRSLLLCRLKINLIRECGFGTNVSISTLSTVIDELSRSWTVECSPG